MREEPKARCGFGLSSPSAPSPRRAPPAPSSHCLFQTDNLLWFPAEGSVLTPPISGALTAQVVTSHASSIASSRLALYLESVSCKILASSPHRNHPTDHPLSSVLLPCQATALTSLQVLVTLHSSLPSSLFRDCSCKGLAGPPVTQSWLTIQR